MLLIMGFFHSFSACAPEARGAWCRSSSPLLHGSDCSFRLLQARFKI